MKLCGQGTVHVFNLRVTSIHSLQLPKAPFTRGALYGIVLSTGSCRLCDSFNRSFSSSPDREVLSPSHETNNVSLGIVYARPANNQKADSEYTCCLNSATGPTWKHVELTPSGPTLLCDVTTGAAHQNPGFHNSGIAQSSRFCTTNPTH